MSTMSRQLVTKPLTIRNYNGEMVDCDLFAVSREPTIGLASRSREKEQAMRVISSLVHAIVKRRRPRFLEPSPMGVSYSIFPTLPPIDPSDELTIRRVEVARQEGFNEGSEQAYRRVNLSWRNRWWWQRLHSPDLREDMSRLEWVFWPLVNGWRGWRVRRKSAAIDRSRQLARS